VKTDGQEQAGKSERKTLVGLKSRQGLAYEALVTWNKRFVDVPGDRSLEMTKTSPTAERRLKLLPLKSPPKKQGDSEYVWILINDF
jgi:hypothetical protein